MRFSKSFFPTMKEIPRDCDMTSQIYMRRAGMIEQTSSGLFTYLPYFNMLIANVAAVIRKHMAVLDAQECKFPILVSREVLDQSGRWDAFGAEMFKLQDRHEVDYAISPTNEEAACLIAKKFVESYRDLPFTIYQIQQKHRDEIRPRGGVMRAREFIMKDAYSFNSSIDDMMQCYQRFVDEYTAIFAELGIKTVPVQADSGAMGGSGSREVMAIAADGESELAICECGFAANIETVTCSVGKDAPLSALSGRFEKVYTPNCHTIDDLVGFFNATAQDFVKSMIFCADDKLIAVLLRGDRTVNPIKLKRITGATSIELATAEEIAAAGSVIGFVGPVGLKLPLYVDYEVRMMQDFIIGANEHDYHYKQANNADFSATYCDVRNAEPGDKCPECGRKYSVECANELGHCFALGTRYTDKLDLTFVDSDGERKRMYMGCYGIGLERTVAAIIDQHHDEHGMILPKHIAPLQVDVIPTDSRKPELTEAAENLYRELQQAGVRVIIDDRASSAGFKFKDADLLGIPLKIICGKSMADGMVEFSVRESGEKRLVPIAEACAEVQKFLAE